MKQSTKKLAWTAFKLAAAGATLWGVALAVLSIGPDGEIAESTADVWDFTKFEETPQKKFARSLERLGHEPPRVFDNNGYTVFFSTRVSRKTPEQLVHEYQHTFVAEGVNREMHLTTPDDLADAPAPAQERYTQKRMQDTLTGEVLPFTANDKYMMMGGGLMRGAPINKAELSRHMDQQRRDNMDVVVQTLKQTYMQCGGDPAKLDAKAREFAESGLGEGTHCRGDGLCKSAEVPNDTRVQAMALKELLLENREDFQDCPLLGEAVKRIGGEQGFDSQMAGYRTVEAFRDPKAGTTSVTAVWTDEDFDARKAFPEKYGNDAARPDGLPMCRDCQATWNMGGNGRDDGYGTTLMHSDDSLGLVEDFYQTKLAEDGWEPVAGDIILNKIYDKVGNPVPDGRSLRYQRDGEYLRILLAKDDEHGRTNITITRSPN